MYSPIPVCLCLLVCLKAASSDQVIFGHEDESMNLLKDKNWDFENDVSSDDWIVRSASVERLDRGCNTGQSCLRVFDRKSKDGGIAIRVTGLKPSTSYYFSIFIKQMTNRSDGAPYSRIRSLGKYQPVSGSVVNFNLGRLTYMRADDDWKQLGGDFITADEEVNFHEFWIRGEPTDIEYMADTAALTELPAPSNFKKETDKKIDAVRKTDLTIVGKVPKGASVAVKLVNHEFGFGTAINGKPFIGTSDAETKYREFILKYFNWAVFENDMKWKPMEKRKGAVNFWVVDSGIAILKENNMKIRGHAISWDLMESNPPWVTGEEGNTLKDELFRRVNYVVDHYKGNITEWDVCNEYLHTHFFEAKTGLLEIIEDEFREVIGIDPNTRLFLNDYQVVRDGQYTSAQANLARYLLSRGTPVHGVGIQSHLRDIPIRPEILAKRVQIAGSAGLPITITEFSAHSYNVSVRAQAVEEAFRIYFADPNVHAIMLWGFGDQYSGFADDFFLFNGPDNTPNEAGEALLKLFKKWRTFKKLTSPDGKINKTIRAFYGDYVLTVKKGKEVLDTKTFKVTRDGDNILHL